MVQQAGELLVRDVFIAPFQLLQRPVPLLLQGGQLRVLWRLFRRLRVGQLHLDHLVGKDGVGNQVHQRRDQSQPDIARRLVDVEKDRADHPHGSHQVERQHRALFSGHFHGTFLPHPTLGYTRNIVPAPPLPVNGFPHPRRDAGSVLH